MITIKSQKEIELLRKAGQIVYQTHLYLKPFLKAGITTIKLDELAESGLLILNGYQYLVGNLLSFNILDKIDREYSNKIMIDITNQLGNHSIDSISQLFEINLSSEKNIESKNGFQKKLIPNPKNNN